MKSVVPDVPLPAYTSQGFNEETKAVFDEYDAIDIKYKDLLGKRILLTGASSGIGRQVARKLLRSGVYLIVLGRNPDALAELARDPKARGVVKPYECDIEKPVALEETFFRIMEENDGKLDGLINTVGTTLCADFRDTTLKEFDFLMNINVRTAMQLMSMASRFLKESHGVIVNVSAPDVPMPKATLFCLTKACLNMLTQCAALELSAHGVRVNAVAPGFVNTPMRMHQREAPISQAENDALMREAAKRAPLKHIPTEKELASRTFTDTKPKDRTPTDKEVADAIVWLVSEQSSFVNGQIVNVDCGANVASTSSDLSWHKPKIAVTPTQASVQGQRQTGLFGLAKFLGGD